MDQFLEFTSTFREIVMHTDLKCFFTLSPKFVREVKTKFNNLGLLYFSLHFKTHTCIKILHDHYIIAFIASNCKNHNFLTQCPSELFPRRYPG